MRPKSPLHALAVATMSCAFVAPNCFGQDLRPRDIDALPSSGPTATAAFGSSPQQVGDLRVPEGRGPFPVVVVIHGGCWTAGYATRRNTAAISTALAARGFATWNIEYRQVGEPGGGWPGSFQDWGRGVDHVRALAKEYPLDLKRVVVVGHSAGAHAALWVAARRRLPEDSEIGDRSPLPVRAAVAIDGPGNLAGFIGLDAVVCGKPVIVPLMGATPDAEPERYRQATPEALLPLGIPQLLVVGTVLTASSARACQRTGEANGDVIEVLELDPGHFEAIAPEHRAWRSIEERIVRLGLQ